jgi:hypothetical protein
MIAPPPRSDWRSVRRRSTRRPRGSGRKRRVGTARIGSRMARIAALAWAISSAEVRAQTVVCRTSLGEKVRVASSSTGDSSSASPWPGC